MYCLAGSGIRRRVQNSPGDQKLP
ncbi:unnamed protein product [Ectocarpus sp. CCAP 1310/34]|nr:unnamed protein product [Ectocarpus sp. CCAP 1310/34]